MRFFSPHKIFSLISAGVLLAPVFATAQQVAATQPSLQALDRGFQTLYGQVDASVVHVIVPLRVATRVVAAPQPVPNDPQQAFRVNHEELDTTQPLLQPPVRIAFAEFSGLIYDDQGHVLVPLFIDKTLVNNSELPVSYGDNRMTTARLIGADDKTNLAVLKLSEIVGKPTVWTDEQPPPGALVLMVSPVRRQIHLSMWSGGHDEHAVVFNSSGDVTGFIRFGHMLEPRAFRPVVKQLIETGTVHRASLGVIIQELGPGDPARSLYREKLGNRPAARVMKLDVNSPAAAGGVQPNDLILTLGGEPMNDLPHFAAALTVRSGPTPLKILRDGQEMTLTVNLQVQ